MKYRQLAKTDEQLSSLGLGCMGMSYAYGPTNEADNLATLHKALDLGINFWDTADVYGAGANEELLSKVLVDNRDKVFIATKFGFRYDKEARLGGAEVDCSPQWIRQAVEKSLQRLKIDTIDLYYAHRIDVNVPVEETVGAMADLVKEGKVRYLGLSEASAQTIRKANAIHPISALQYEYSVLTRDPEREILPTARELGISLIPYSPLSRGLITNRLDVSKMDASNDFRKHLPRYQGKNLENNNKLAAAFAEFAEQRDITASQLALAWVLAQGEDIIPIPGTKRVKYLEENAKAVDVNLSQADLNAIDDILAKYPEVGDRYTDEQFKYTNH
ncbi:aldo/keto reductase [Dysgonomonas termitidis]|uniref:Aldo/keto reductase n=1 Tax=Dysgonomonas termitidis TaxID=1516126 RepID=A0ABV9L233_9BACT